MFVVYTGVKEIVIPETHQSTLYENHLIVYHCFIILEHNAAYSWQAFLFSGRLCKWPTIHLGIKAVHKRFRTHHTGMLLFFCIQIFNPLISKHKAKPPVQSPSL
jgi:hypothetical protein